MNIVRNHVFLFVKFSHLGVHFVTLEIVPWGYLHSNGKGYRVLKLVVLLQFSFIRNLSVHSSHKVWTTQVSHQQMNGWKNVVCACNWKLAIKRNKILMHGTTWMNLANTVLSQKSQTKKDKISYDCPYKRYLEQSSV